MILLRYLGVVFLCLSACQRPKLTLRDPPLFSPAPPPEDFGADTLAIPPSAGWSPRSAGMPREPGAVPELKPRPIWPPPHQLGSQEAPTVKGVGQNSLSQAKILHSKSVESKVQNPQASGLNSGRPRPLLADGSSHVPRGEPDASLNAMRAITRPGPSATGAEKTDVAITQAQIKQFRAEYESGPPAPLPEGSGKRPSGLTERGITGLPVRTETHVGVGTLVDGEIDGKPVKVIHGGLHTVQGMRAFVSQLPERLQKLVQVRTHPENGVVQVVFPREAFDDKGWRGTEVAARMGGRGEPGGKSLFPENWTLQEISNAAHLAVKRGLVEVVTTTGNRYAAWFIKDKRNGSIRLVSSPQESPRNDMVRVEACTDSPEIGRGLIHTTYTSWVQNPKHHNDTKGLRDSNSMPPTAPSSLTLAPKPE